MDFVVPLFFIIFVVIGIYLLTQAKFQVVPEEERLVIYRLGRFQRIAGPGPVFLLRNLDEVKRRFSVRDEPHNIRINGLFINGVPFGYTLNFWYRFDLMAAAPDDRARLVNLAQFSDDERKQQVATKVREALVASAARLERGYKPAGNDFFDKLLPIMPGLPEFEALFAEVGQQLRATLPLVGAILNEAHPITVTNIHLGNDILNSFSRGRIANLLKETFPALAPELLLQAVSAIEGIDMPQQRVVFEGSNYANAAMDFRVDEEGATARVRVPPKGGLKQPSAPQPIPPQSPVVTETATTAEDWSVLKQVPAA
ncbi:MAG: SPFH domain-containing protein [Caldilineaceae bacterium]|nr:SPFH domain-containing protein [Caldilineaceae bacterium]